MPADSTPGKEEVEALRWTRVSETLCFVSRQPSPPCRVLVLGPEGQGPRSWTSAGVSFFWDPSISCSARTKGVGVAGRSCVSVGSRPGRRSVFRGGLGFQVTSETFPTNVPGVPQVCGLCLRVRLSAIPRGDPRRVGCVSGTLSLRTSRAPQPCGPKCRAERWGSTGATLLYQTRLSNRSGSRWLTKGGVGYASVLSVRRASGVEVSTFL